MLGFVRLGFIDVILSRALLRGFVTAIAVVITMQGSRFTQPSSHADKHLVSS